MTVLGTTLLIGDDALPAGSGRTFDRANPISGGRFGGLAGIDAFTELRWISMQVEPRVHPF
jgi:hypothetical protein